MNNEQLKSVIRHALTAIGAVVTLLGIAKFTNLLDYLNTNFDTIWAAVATIVGLITTVLGFFKNSERFQLRGNK